MYPQQPVLETLPHPTLALTGSLDALAALAWAARECHWHTCQPAEHLQPVEIRICPKSPPTASRVEEALPPNTFLRWQLDTVTDGPWWDWLPA